MKISVPRKKNEKMTILKFLLFLIVFMSLFFKRSDRFVRFVGELPYSRMLEEEADRVGLEIAAKACYDVR